ncbi:MAG: PAS domain S-box protein [Polaromonas sp.]|nr:PAS domain S-box protein [Polaromonas sp.]
MQNWLGLRTRLVLLVLLALLPVFGLFAYSAAQSRKAALEQAESSLQSQVLLAAAQQQLLVERVYEHLDGIASGLSVKNPPTGLCGLYLKSLHAGHPEFTNLGVVGLDGKLVCSARDVTGGIQVGDRPFFKQVLAGQRFAVGQYGVGRSSELPGVGFAVPVYSPGGQLDGVAFAVLGLKALNAALAGVPTLPGTRLAVLDRNGTVLAAYPAAPSWLGKAHQDGAVRRAVQTRQQGVLYAADATATQQVRAFAPVPGGGREGLFVAISVPREVITAGPRENLRMDLVALLAVALFGVACAWSMGKRLIVNPSRAILKEANEVIRGNLAARVKLGPLYQGELRKISLSFNRMAESLQARQDELGAALGQMDKKHSLLDLILNSMSEGVIAVDTEGRFLLFNTTARQLFPAPESGASFFDWRQDNKLLTLDGKTVSRDDGPLTQTLGGASIDHRELLFRRPGTEDRILSMSTRPLRGAGNQLVGGVTVFGDITERKAAESFSLAQEQVLALIAGGAALAQSLEEIVRLIEKRSPDSLCSILLVEGQQLRHGAAPGLPDSFGQAIDSLPIGEGVGACGTAAFRKEPVVVEDVEQDPLMHDYRELLLAHELRACWSTPVLATDGEVLATFAIYRRTPCKPQPRDLELMVTATRLARLALERARAKAGLVSSEARFREVAENTDDVFYNIDATTGRVLYISPAYEKICGRSCASLYANPASYAASVIAEDRPLLERADARNHAGETTDVEYRILSADGQTHWIREHAYPVFNAAGEVERVVGTVRDITARKQADLTLASTNRALQMLSRSSMAVNRIDDEASLLAEVCRVAVEVGGYRMAWVGYAQDDDARSIQPMAHAGDESGYLDSIEVSWRDDYPTGQGPSGQAIRGGQPVQSGDISRSDSFYWRDGALQRGYRSSIGLPLRDGPRSFGVLCLYAGEVQQFADEEVKLLQELADNLAFGILSLRARLERRRSQEVARQAAVKLREQASLLDRAQDAIVVRNLDRTLRYWNKGAERLYGWSAEEVLGKTMDDVMYRSPQVLITAMNQIIASDGDWTGELEQVARDGSTVYVDVRATVVRDEQGQVNGMLGINTDIRERKRAREEILRLNASLEERVLQRTAQLEFANKQLEAFSYSVSHDLRSPLNAIDGFSSLLERTVVKMESGPLTERSAHYLTRIRAGVLQMGELIDALLSLAQVSRVSLRWEPVDISTLAEALLSRFQEREPGRATQLQVEAGLHAQGDPRLLNQVLDNLLGNAWKFSAGQARTEITVGHETSSAGETVYFVRDNGAGFDMAYADKLFASFQRLHTQAEFAGTGIGLATVQRIIERHGGKIWGESAPGCGATFYFTLSAASL